MKTPKLILHGGAGSWKNHNPDDVLAVMRRAAAVGWQLLQDGQSAMDAVEASTKVMEDSPLFNAGVGSSLNQWGEVEMDAIIVDGDTVDFGAVGAVMRIKNPISLARLVLQETPHKFLVATGAEALAQDHGLPMAPGLQFVTSRAFEAFQKSQDGDSRSDTVGAVALDQHGKIAVATTTGGMARKMKGRVGDSPIFGAGGYADSQIGGASATGIGEDIMRFLGSKRCIDLIESGLNAQEAARQTVNYIATRVPQTKVGIIAIDQQGGVGASCNTDGMPVAWVTAGGTIEVSMRR